MNQKLAAFFFYMVLLTQVKGQLTENHVGFSHEIASTTLETSMRVKVYLPASYEDADQAYPVIYLLDGQRFFLYGVSLLDTYQQYKLTPEFIVVGIDTPYPRRFGHFSSGSASFIDFISSEVFPLIEQNYRISDEKLIFGWEYGGSLVFKILTQQKALFDGYLMASPFPVMDQVDALMGQPFRQQFLYFSVSPDEFSVNHGVNKLDSMLTSGKITGLQWTHLKLSEEVHRSTPYSTLYHGIKKYFQYYPELQIDNLEKFIEQGALSYAYDYNEKRSEQYGFPKALSAWTKFTIIRSAMRADDYARFSEFSEALRLAEFYQELSDSRISDLADFLANNEGFDQATQMYRYLLEKYPESIILLTKIGNTLRASGKASEAKIYLDKAATLSSGPK